ncbi:MAG: hypothetical protein ACOYM5_10005 [Caulobacter sp.]
MNPVRPNVWANVPPPGQGSGQGAAKSAAQRAFFDQALGKASGAPQQTQSPATPVRTAPVQAQAAPQPVQRMPAAQPSEQPTRILRPGSLLDIRV